VEPSGAKVKRILLTVRHLQQWIEHNVLLFLKPQSKLPDEHNLIL
jgi:hypothetical protein